ncbi:sortase [Candidatus Saccharibacteria bacterium]|nr:sortase [Candidatus Saccharibacteria bacterium]
MKRYFLILLMVFGVGLIATPNVSTAKEPEVNFDEIVEITNLTELEPISEIKIEDIAEDAQITTPVYATKATTSTTVNFSYTVTQKTNSIVENPSNSDIYKTGKLVYAHNDPSLMLSALSLSKGSIFTITENGITKTYQVAETEIFAKTDLQAIIPGTKRNYMSEVTYSAKNPNTGKTHNLALMTCYERTRGATHRFVVFANEI